jgi:hypothetical protein
LLRAVLYSWLAVVVAGVLAAPGLGALALVVAPLIAVGVAWRIGVAAVTHGRFTEAIVRTRHRQFLGPGGPDDSFAREELDADLPSQLP